MGGGDLNLKKSWHPSTMKNMEKVWKAEQAHKQEQKRIAELQKEMREEREREEIQKFAEDQGVVEKRNDSKLDWMYKGPASLVNREEYLLGRPVDKTLEQIELEDKKQEKGQLPASTSNTIEYDCTPASIFSGGGSEQVDLARKIQEDPLFQIRKKEEETRRKILDNPVKMKQLQMMMKDSQREKKKKRKHKKKRKRKGSSSTGSMDDSEEDLSTQQLDRLLAKKYSSLKNKLSREDIRELGRYKGERNKSSHKNEEQQDNMDKMEYSKRKHRRLNSSPEEERRRKHSDFSHNKKERISERSRDCRSRSHSPEHQQSEEHTRSTSPVMRKKVEKMPQRKKMDEKEMERKRQEMMENAVWRDEQRKRNVERYKEEETREREKHTDQYGPEFIRKQLSAAASSGSVEKRVRANVYNIQRSGFSMDKNFARR